MSTLPSNQPAANRGVQNRKQPTNIYTVMMIVSFLALLIACIFLAVEMNRYGEFPYWDTREAQPSTTP